MSSSSKHNTSFTKKDNHLHQPPKIENHKNPTKNIDLDELNPNPKTSTSNPLVQEMESIVSASNRPLVINGAEEDSILQKSDFLTREEVIRRRLRRVRQLEKLYRDHYWVLMEELRASHRKYVWEYGKSPFQEDEDRENAVDGTGVVEGTGENHNNGINNGSNSRLGLGENGGFDGRYKKCGFSGCKTKAMALTTYCHQHILSDSKQTLYRPCNYVIKSINTGNVHCGKPILRSNIPSLCSIHLPRAEKHVTQALKRAGLNITSSTKLAPKFHLIVAESVRQINAKRRERRAEIAKLSTIEENAA